MRVVLYFTDNVADPQVLLFDLNFALSNYSKTHTIEFPNASPELLNLLTTTPRKGGKKPMSSAPSSKSDKESSSNSKHTSKKKPVSSSPNVKASKKSKPEYKSSSLSSTASPVTTVTKRTGTSSQKSSISSPLPLARSPSFTDLSPMVPSIYSSPAQKVTATPEFVSETDENEQEVGVVISDQSSTNDMDNDRTEHVYNMSDVYNLSSIHHASIDQSVCDKWGIPQVCELNAFLIANIQPVF